MVVGFKFIGSLSRKKTRNPLLAKSLQYGLICVTLVLILVEHVHCYTSTGVIMAREGSLPVLYCQSLEVRICCQDSCCHQIGS